MELSTVPKGVATTDDERHWLEKAVLSLLSYGEDDDVFGSAREAIDDAGRKAFKISTALGVVPGPVGTATILPEMIALTRLQVRLIHRIARHYGKQERVNRELILLILGNAMGIAAGEVLLRRAGKTLVVKSVSSGVIKRLSRRIGARIVDRAVERAIARWIPLVTAPLFGYFSRSLTRRIGREAERLFSREIEIETVGGPLP